LLQEIFGEVEKNLQKAPFQKVTFGRIMPLYFLIIALEKKVGGV
jgi:hypothetical protein